MTRYALAIFLSAFLLFQVQPMMGKSILPWFGGSPSVWTTCMLFFQVLLLAGYAYAHGLRRWLAPRAQVVAHLALLAASAAVVSVIPDPSWEPVGSDAPTWRVLALLAATIGAPYAMLSTTGPLLQAWFHHARPGENPYRLYALSNAGSLLALLSYPFLFEPLWTLATQARLWSWGYYGFAVMVGWTAVDLWRRSASAAEVEHVATSETEAPRPTWRAATWWLVLAACGSTLLLATTNQICQEVAVVPFLWVAPLTIYLLTFILCFDHPRWRRPAVAELGFIAMLTPAAVVVCAGATAGLWVQVGVYCLTLYFGAMVCHGELAEAKPHPRYLTLFFLMVAVGGAAGGLFVAILAPLVFTGFWELHLSLAAAGLIAIVAFHRRQRGNWSAAGPRLKRAFMLGSFSLVVVILAGHAYVLGWDVLDASRNFYGIVRVSERDDKLHGPRHELWHGQTLHGYQFTSAEKRRWPTSYYGGDSGVTMALTAHPRRFAGESLRVGVVGLGVGTIAAFAQPGDVHRYYEINPAVIRLAESRFTYLADSAAQIDVVQGDARIMLKQEAVAGGREYDVLAIDAFSSDSVPMHLLTREGVEVYLRNLRSDGILCFNISNRVLDLTPIVRGLAREFQRTALLYDSDGDRERGTKPSKWVLLTRNELFIAAETAAGRVTPWPADSPEPVLWTDDFASLLQAPIKAAHLFSIDWEEVESVLSKR